MEDQRELLADEQEFTTQEASEDCIDLQEDDLQLGVNGKLVIKFLVTTVFTGLDDDLDLEVIDGSANTDGVIDTDIRVLAAKRGITLAEVAAGKQHQIPVPAMKLQRYLGARFTPVSDAANSGAMTIGISVASESEIT